MYKLLVYIYQFGTFMVKLPFELYDKFHDSVKDSIKFCKNKVDKQKAFINMIKLMNKR